MLAFRLASQSGSAEDSATPKILGRMNSSRECDDDHRSGWEKLKHVGGSTACAGRRAGLLIVTLWMLVSGCGLFFAKTDFFKATAEGKLKVGMTADEVRAVLGNPDTTKGGTAGTVPVDMWIYKQTSHEDRTNYLATTAVTLGLWGIVPVLATEQHYVVLAGGKVVSWDSIPKSIQIPREFVEDRPEHGRMTTGTGFAIGRGYFLTNNHVVDGMIRPLVYGRTEAYPVTVALRDETNDVALVKLAASGRPDAGMLWQEGLPLGDVSTVKQGDRVWTLGFPLTNVLGEKPILTEGTISSTYGVGEDPRFFQISVPIQPGNSGGPLLNERGEVIALTVSTMNAAKFFQMTGTMPQNINFAVKITYAKSLIALLPETEKPFLQSGLVPAAGRSLSDLVEIVRPHVVLIKETP